MLNAAKNEALQRLGEVGIASRGWSCSSAALCEGLYLQLNADFDRRRL
jgi:hypothetical protein